MVEFTKEVLLPAFQIPALIPHQVICENSFFCNDLSILLYLRYLLKWCVSPPKQCIIFILYLRNIASKCNCLTSGDLRWLFHFWSHISSEFLYVPKTISFCSFWYACDSKSDSSWLSIYSKYLYSKSSWNFSKSRCIFFPISVFHLFESSPTATAEYFNNSCVLSIPICKGYIFTFNFLFLDNCE